METIITYFEILTAAFIKKQRNKNNINIVEAGFIS